MVVTSYPLNMPTILRAVLPSTVPMPNGDLIQLEWHPAEENVARGVMPYGTMMFLGEAMRDNTHRHYGFVPGTATVDTATRTFVTGTEEYLLDHYDAVAITSVVGTVGGVPATTIAAPGNWELASLPPGEGFFDLSTFDELAPEETTMPNAIRFLGGITPDNGTAFVVTYTYYVENEQRVIDSTVSFRLTMHAAPLAIGERGATVAYPKHLLASYIGEGVLAYLRIRQGKGLTSIPGELILKRAFSLGFGQFDPADSVRRSVIDVFLSRRYKLKEADVFRVRDTDAPTYDLSH